MEQQIEKYFLGELDLKEKIKLLQKVKSDEELKAIFTYYQNKLALLSFSDFVINTKESKRSYALFVKRCKKNKIRRIVFSSVKYAAAISLIILSVHLFHLYSYSPKSIIAGNTTLYVPPSQRLCVTLEDGTEVWLNAQTKLTYPTTFSGKERRVIVEGEAFFKVAKDESKPFIVTSNHVDIKVLGTEFNIYSYPDEQITRVSLLAGSLQVFCPEAEKTVDLKPNEEVTIQNNQLLVNKIPNKDYFLWKDGIYSFENESLGEILKKLELYYDIDIVVKKPAMLEWKYTVKFRQRDGIDEILRLLQRINTFSIYRDEENNTITIDIKRGQT